MEEFYNDERTVFSIVVQESLGMGRKGIAVMDTEENNVIIFDNKSRKPELFLENHTIQMDSINEIKSLISKSRILSIGELEIPDYWVLDGNDEYYTFSDGNESVTIEAANFSKLYTSFKGRPNAGTFNRTVRKILKILKDNEITFRLSM